jgi:hypothetical protein
MTQPTTTAPASGRLRHEAVGLRDVTFQSTRDMAPGAAITASHGRLDDIEVAAAAGPAS